MFYNDVHAWTFRDVLPRRSCVDVSWHFTTTFVPSVSLYCPCPDVIVPRKGTQYRVRYAHVSTERHHVIALRIRYGWNWEVGGWSLKIVGGERLASKIGGRWDICPQNRWEVGPQNRWEMGGWLPKQVRSCEVETPARSPQL